MGEKKKKKKNICNFIKNIYIKVKDRPKEQFYSVKIF